MIHIDLLFDLTIQEFVDIWPTTACYQSKNSPNNSEMDRGGKGLIARALVATNLALSFSKLISLILGLEDPKNTNGLWLLRPRH